MPERASAAAFTAGSSSSVRWAHSAATKVQMHHVQHGRDGNQSMNNERTHRPATDSCFVSLCLCVNSISGVQLHGCRSNYGPAK